MHRLSSFFGDLARLPLALWLWNWRKSRYRWRRGRGRCPCQHPSDSGEAGETGCDACMDWSEPRRFRWVCPLLVPGEHGWHCAAHAEDVRPFWGRAAMIVLGAVLSIYLAATLGTWSVLRVTGVDGLAWWDVAWPSNWSRVSSARARYFTRETARFLQLGEFAAAELALSSALQLAPDNFEATLFLGHLRQYQGRFGESDAIFRRLHERLPARAQESAVAWHDALLLRQRYGVLAELSLHMASSFTEQRQEWTRSLLFALRHARGVPAYVEQNASLIATLPRPSQTLIWAEDLRNRSRPAEAVSRLMELSMAGLSPLLAGEIVEELLLLGARDQADVFLQRQMPGLPPVDWALLRMRIDQASGDAALVRMDFEQLLRLPLTRPLYERLVAALIDFPDQKSFARLHRAVSDPVNQSLVTGAEMWIAAMQCGATAEAAQWARHCFLRLGLRVPAIKALNFSSNLLTDPTSVPRIVAIGRLPREVIFSLFRKAAQATPAVDDSQP